MNIPSKAYCETCSGYVDVELDHEDLSEDTAEGFATESNIERYLVCKSCEKSIPWPCNCQSPVLECDPQYVDGYCSECGDVVPWSVWLAHEAEREDRVHVHVDPEQPAEQPFDGSVLDYFRSHAIDAAVATTVGVRQEGDSIVFPYVAEDGSRFERRRSLNGGPKVRQPKGAPLTLWQPRPATNDQTIALVCEGESDAVAALSALRVAPFDDLRELPVYAIPGTGMPAERAVDALTQTGITQAWLAFDADDAGRRYFDKIAPLLLSRGIKVFCVFLPEGQDLADLLATVPARERGEWIADALLEASAVDDEFSAGGILTAIETYIRRYVVLPGEHEAAALALFVAHTHALEAAHATPYLIVLSPEKRSGKTLLLEVLELLVARPWRIVSTSESAMFRKISQDRPTLLLDEIDAIFGSNSDRTEPLRAILNAGNRPGSAVARCVGEGAKQMVVDFEVYGPKLLAGIDTGRLPDTIRDRGVEIRMQRKTAIEAVERFRRRRAVPIADDLRKQVADWAERDVGGLRDAEPELPAELNDRAAEAWEPLFAIADLAGDEWPTRARAAALALAEGASVEEVSHGTRALAKLAMLLRDRSVISTQDAIDALNADEELPFGGWRDGRGLDARVLARLLKPYGLRPRTVRLPDGTTPKGYHRDEAAEEAFARYLVAPQTTDPPQKNPHEMGVVADVADVADFSQGELEAVA